MLKANRFLIAIVTTLFFVTVSAQETAPEERVWTTYKEEIITAKVLYKAGYFSSEKEVEIYGILWTPRVKKGEPVKKLPLFVISHGSQSSNLKHVITANADGAALTLMENGFAVFAPVRKGFRRAGDPPTDVNVDSSEPIDCRSWPAQEAGLKSAKEDTRALLDRLRQREDIDMSKVILAGQSRGGFLSVALAAEQLPGLVGVINLVGGWHSEPCLSGSSFNSTKLSQFAKDIKVPILSYYGTNDAYYTEQAVRNFVSILSQNPKAVGVITPGYNHSAHRRDYEPWVAAATKLVKGE